MKEKDNRGVLSNEESERLGSLIRKHRNVIRATVFKILGSQFRYLLEDCTSEVAVIAVQQGAELLSHPNPAGWFVLASKNTANNMLRKERTRLRKEIIDSDLQIQMQDDPLEEVAYADWIENGIPDKLLSRLAPREREIYDMIFVQDMGITEIARELSLSESTVRNIKKNVLDKIKYAIQTHDF